MDLVMEKGLTGDWLLLYLLGQNIEANIFKEVIHELAKRLGYRSKDYSASDT